MRVLLEGLNPHHHPPTPPPPAGRYGVPPYWTLGFHLSRFGHWDLSHLQAARGRTADAAVPHDALWGDIEVMGGPGLSFTINQEL